jgi:acetylornithine deacetylase/succinyl-diaminopimelate desuccinylase-like protein
MDVVHADKRRKGKEKKFEGSEEGGRIKGRGKRNERRMLTGREKERK